MNRRTRAAAALPFILACLGAGDAGSEEKLPREADLAEARVHFTRGIELHREGQFDAARRELELAYALAPSARLLYNLGLAASAQGDRASAIGYLESYVEKEGAEITPERRREVDDLLRDLRARVAYVSIHANVADAELSVDAHAAGRVHDPVILNPGEHRLVLTRAGYVPAEQRITVHEGERAVVTLDLHVPSRSVAWRDRREVRWGAPIAGGLVLVVIVALARRRRTPATAAPEVLNPYAAGPPSELEIVQPTRDHAQLVLDEPAPAAVAAIRLASGAATDRGLVKPTNQDSHAADVATDVYVVADGIGGFAGGEVASAMAVAGVVESLRARKTTLESLAHLPPPAAELATALWDANVAIRRRQAADRAVADMGTTCVAAWFAPKERRLFAAHVGDSRMYRLRRGALQQLTTDHTMAELGIAGKRANHLSRALGTEPCPKLDLLVLAPLPGDVYLLCCDGLDKMVPDREIAEVLGRSAEPAAIATDLVARANAHGGADNITAVVVRVEAG